MEFVPLMSKNPTSPRSFFGKKELEAKWECTTAGTGGSTGHDENARRFLWGLQTPLGQAVQLQVRQLELKQLEPEPF